MKDVINLDRYCFSSWSGGKDSCFALHSAMEEGYQPKKLLTMFSQENKISSAHLLNEDIIRAQSEAIGIECLMGKSMFDEYEEVFATNLRLFKEQGIEFGVFGDIDLLPHREWVEKVCKKTGIIALLPLWQQKRKELVKNFLDSGFKAKIIVVNTGMMDTRFLGQELNYSLLEEIEESGVDVCGENGEYHTVVYDGPIFKRPVDFKFGTEIIYVGESWARIEVSLLNSTSKKQI